MRLDQPDRARDTFFSRVARLYDLNLFLNGYPIAVAALLKRLPLAPDRPLSVLDAGCGSGLYTFGILDAFPAAHVTAFDCNAAMVAQTARAAARRGVGARIHLLRGDITDRQIALPHGFDLIVTGGVLEYGDMPAAIGNLARFLARDGYFLNAPVKANALGRLIGRWCHFRPYSRQHCVEAFTTQGFALRTIYSLPRYLPISLVKEAHLFHFPIPVLDS